MGFETIVATIVSLSLIITVAYLFASGSVSLTEVANTGYKSAIHRAVNVLQTDISILNVTYNNSTLQIIAYIKNTGETKFKDFDRFDVFLYGTLTEYLANRSFTIVRDIINPGIFDPHETAEVKANLTSLLPNGTYVLTICTPNAVCDSIEFNV